MIFRQLFEPDTCTYTFLLGCERTRQAVLIDTVLSQAENHRELVDRLDLNLVMTLETHIHADHVTGSGYLRHAVECQVSTPHDEGVTGSDVQVRDGDRLVFGGFTITAIRTPGHTGSCTSYLVEDRLFTGDSLRIGTCGRTDFQSGDPGTLYDSIMNKLYTLPPDTLLYPGHDYKGLRVSTIAQEMQTNARLRHDTVRAEFVEYAESLVLDPPRYMAQAVPANFVCGDETALEEAAALSSAEDWVI